MMMAPEAAASMTSDSVMAPVAEGAPVGALKVWIGQTLSQETPLYTAETVGLGALHQRAADAAMELLTGWLR